MKETEDPVSNSARALTIPCRDSTMTWHVINRMLERTDTYSEAVVVSDELAGGGGGGGGVLPGCIFSIPTVCVKQGVMLLLTLFTMTQRLAFDLAVNN